MLSNMPKRPSVKDVRNQPEASKREPRRDIQVGNTHSKPQTALSEAKAANSGPSEEQFRIFVAIPLPPDVHRALVPVLATLREQLPSARFVRADQAHVTLKFYGDVGELGIAGLIAALRPEIAKIHRFSFEISGAGAFPNTKKARVLWLGITEFEPSLADLAKAVERGSAIAGFAAETREFRAHLTLARPRGRDDVIRGADAALTPLRNLRMGPILVDKAILYRSVLNKTGSVYTPLSVFPLS